MCAFMSTRHCRKCMMILTLLVLDAGRPDCHSDRWLASFQPPPPFFSLHEREGEPDI